MPIRRWQTIPQTAASGALALLAILLVPAVVGLEPLLTEIFGDDSVLAFGGGTLG